MAHVPNTAYNSVDNPQPARWPAPAALAHSTHTKPSQTSYSAWQQKLVSDQGSYAILIALAVAWSLWVPAIALLLLPVRHA